MKTKMQKISQNKYFKAGWAVAQLLFGCMLMGFAFATFYTPQNIVPSGFTGLATIISYLIGLPWLTPSIIYLAMNIVLFIVTFRYFGWRFAVMTVVGILAYTIAMEYFTIPLGSLNPEESGSKLLCALIGGAIHGVGAGITFRAGGSTGGSDFVTLLVNKFFPRIKTGQCQLIINIFIILLSFIVYGISGGLYSIVIAFVVAKMTDAVLDGTNAVRAFYIICDKDEEVAEKILQTFHRGVTRIDAEGAFSHKKKTILMCLVTNYQATAMKSIIKEVDPNSFMFSTAVRESLGEPFFVREVSERKRKITGAQLTLKSMTKYNRRLGKRLSKKNKLKLYKPSRIALHR